MQTDPFAVDRNRMIDQIAADTGETANWTGRQSLSPAVVSAMRAVPRHHFVDASNKNAAYENRPLSIGHGQTISQPFIVAIMTELLDLDPADRVLEIGTGSGYQTAVLAQLVPDVWTVERNRELAERARTLFTTLGYGGIHTRCADGALGWSAEAPFHAIIVTAAAEEIPAPLIAQLMPGGRLVVPVGPRGDRQTLYRCGKRTDGALVREAKLSVAFVPLITDV